MHTPKRVFFVFYFHTNGNSKNVISGGLNQTLVKHIGFYFTICTPVFGVGLLTNEYMTPGRWSVAHSHLYSHASLNRSFSHPKLLSRFELGKIHAPGSVSFYNTSGRIEIYIQATSLIQHRSSCYIYIACSEKSQIRK